MASVLRSFADHHVRVLPLPDALDNYTRAEVRAILESAARSILAIADRLSRPVSDLPSPTCGSGLRGALIGGAADSIEAIAAKRD